MQIKTAEIESTARKVIREVEADIKPGSCLINYALGTVLTREFDPNIDELAALTSTEDISEKDFTDEIEPSEGVIVDADGTTQSHAFLVIPDDWLIDTTGPVIVDLAAQQFTEANKTNPDVDVQVSLEDLKPNLEEIELIYPGDPLFNRYKTHSSL